MFGRPLIQDKAIIANFTDRSPVGEVFRSGSFIHYHPMTAAERADTLSRLEQSITKIMSMALSTYTDNCCKEGSTEIDPDYISRISTNEFLFYTREPLTLDEFEILLNKIAVKARNHPSGIHLILGSFAVKTTGNKVMNVVPHIICGTAPQFNFIVKNYTSPVDVRYNIPDGKGNTVLLGVLDRSTHYTPMCNIKVNGENCDFTFNNIVFCQTPGGTEFLTAIDICYDHVVGTAKKHLAENYSDDLPISHVVVSNYINLINSKCLVNNVMHVDPKLSAISCKRGVVQKTVYQGNLPFGNDIVSCLEVDKYPVYTLQEELESARNALISQMTMMGIQVPETSPLYLQCNDDLVFLCIKKHLYINNIPCTQTMAGVIIIEDADLTRDKASFMQEVFASSVEHEKLIQWVHQDQKSLQQVMESKISPLLFEIPSITRFMHYTSSIENILKPKGIILFFQTREEASLFLNALKKYDPDAEMGVTITQSFVSVPFKLLNDTAISGILNTYNETQKKLPLTKTLDELGIVVVSQSPFIMQFPEKLPFLMLKQFLDLNNISYSQTSDGNLKMDDSFSVNQITSMNNIFSIPDVVKLMIASVLNNEKDKCVALCKRVARTAINNHDQLKINDFINITFKSIDAASTFEDLSKLHGQLETMVTHLEKSSSLIKSVVNRLNQSENNEKAARIIDSFCKMSIENRKDILDLNNPTQEALAVHKEIATHQKFTFFRTDILQYNTDKPVRVNPNNSTDSFQFFKEQLDNLKNNIPDDKQDSLNIYNKFA